MKHFRNLLLPVLFFAIFSCKEKSDSIQIFKKIQDEINAGNINSAIHLVDSLKKIIPHDIPVFRKSDSLAQIAERIGIDFSVSEEKVTEQIEKLYGSFSPSEKSAWEKNGWLEFRLINGKKMYFKRAASNLKLIRLFYENKEERLQDIAAETHMINRLQHTEEVWAESDSSAKPVMPVKMKITYTITILPDVVPDGEKIRCWLPWPKDNLPRQQNVRLISTSVPEYIIAPDSAIHSTLYMEKISEKGTPTLFRISFMYESYAQYFNYSTIKALPYNMSSETYIKYTSEQHPHICFTPEVKRVADSITDLSDTPETVVRKIYYWFKNNIPWTGALEYSIIPNIPEYVCQNRRGDCGMQTFLFMSMLRYKGIPVRWQSGWMVPPGDKNLHDWCEVYYEGTGWVPADISYDLQKSDNKEVKEFYISGLDSYRMIVNSGISGPLHPEKQYLRSEPYDFQRGEVEWSGGNLYFDKWDYEMKIEY